MTKFSIEYNPYLVECIFKKNDKEFGANSKFGAKRKERLQVLLNEARNWKGLAEEIAKTCNDHEVQLDFKGRKIDFDDLSYCIERYRGETKFILKFEEARNDNDVIGEMDKLFEEIREKNVPEFSQKTDEEKDVFDVYEEAKNGRFEVSVIATMSSGKSTLINSILHTELLPSENKACTATIARILDNDNMEHYEATTYSANEEEIHKRAVVNKDILREYNEDERVTYIDIEGNIPAISSDKIKLYLRDTPGPNNSRDENHGKLTSSVIKRTNAVVLYVMNATQMEINDDEQLLRNISSEMKRAGKQSRDRFIFVLNKCDALDEEKGETLDIVLGRTREYLKKFDIIDPTIIPTSARMALLIRKKKNGEGLTRKERQELAGLEDWINEPLLHYEKYAVLTPTVREELKKCVDRYHKNEEEWDMEALIHTGVPAVEETIKEYIDKYAYPMKIKDAIKETIDILNEINMKADFEKKIAEDEVTFTKIKEQIGLLTEKKKRSDAVLNEFKCKLEKFNLLEEINPREEQFSVEMELQKMSKKYDGITKVDKNEADYMIKSFQTNLENYQKSCEARINNLLDQKFYSVCENMLVEYKRIISELIETMQVEGYDFSKKRSFKRYTFANIEEVKSKNESKSYHKETRWKDNPERAGFFGFFKFWKPKQISYTVDVFDGINVNVKNVIVDILSGFTRDIKNNIKNLYDEAEKQVKEYKDVFDKNIENLQNEIENMIVELSEKANDRDKVKENLDANQELYQWVSDIEQRIHSILQF